ncbi:general transcription factor 3C polypeptide 4-like isoform X3 [Oculina patagonica]
MADNCTREKKTLETVKLGCLPSYPGAISWSLDDRISVITDQCVYIMTPVLSPAKFGVNVERTSIVCKKPLVLDVAVDKKQITNVESLQWRMDPNVNTSLLCFTGFQKVAWSPLNCDTNGRCVIAALFTEYQLCIYLPPTLGRKWKEAIDVSQVLNSYLAQNNFVLSQDVMQENTQKDYVQPGTNKGISLNSKYSLFKQRTQILAFTCLHWFSQIYHTGGTIFEGNTSENKKFAVLATGNQSGFLMFWRVTIPVILNSATVKLVGFLNTQQSWPCSLSWQEMRDNQGLLAVGGTDGLVKVFSLKVLPSIIGVAQCVLWGDKDDLQVQWLDWLHSPKAHDGLHHLVVCKGPSVVIFSMSVKDGIFIQKPHHKIIQGVHRMPITGLACTRTGTVFTSSLDGSVQTSTVDERAATSVNYDVKKGFVCSGIGVSANALFLALFLSSSNYTQQSLESHQIHIRFVNIAWGPSSVARLLNCKDVQLERRWDVCKAFQHLIYYSKHLPAVEQLQLAPSATDALESCSFAELVIRHHVFSAMMVITRQQECELGGNKSLLNDLSAQLECTVDCMCKRLVSVKLFSWLEGREAGTVNYSDSVSALIMSDWLLMNGSDSAALALVTKVYQACLDTEGLNKVMSLCKESQPNVKPTSMKSVLPQTKASIDSNSVNLQGNNETITELLNENQTSVAVNISVLEGECNARLVTLPVRERCPICKAAIAVESLNYGTCLNGHKWPRCFVTFAVCATLTHRRCQDCNRCVSTPSLGSSLWLRGQLQLTSKCPFCLGFFL